MAVFAALSTIPALAAAVLFPLLFVAFVLYLDRPAKVDVSVETPSLAYVGDDIEISAKVKVEKGFGLFQFQLPTQDKFELVKGTNVHIVFKGLAPVEREYKYTLNALRRGSFAFSKIGYTYSPTLGALRQKIGIISFDKSIDVLPKVKVLKKSQLKIRAKRFMPRSSRSRLGPYSTDFLSIREYTPGDPYKFINWKASSRGGASGTLLVNEYEREGVRTFLFLLDRNETMSRGTREDNPMEYGVVLTLSFARLLLTSGFNAGLWLIPGRAGQVKTGHNVLPGSGDEQFQRMKAVLLEAEIGNQSQGIYDLDPTLKIAREMVPSIIFITSLSNENVSKAGNYANRLLRLGTKVNLIDIVPYSIIARYSLQAQNAQGLKTIFAPTKKKQYQKFIPAGVRVVSWDPVSDSIGRVVTEITQGVTNERK